MAGLNAGTAFITISPSFRGFNNSVSRQMRGQGGTAGKNFSGGFMGHVGKLGAVVGATVGIGAAASFAKGAVTLEAQFSKTMNVLQATTDAPAKAMQNLSDLAMKMGADTVFSAKDAADAMLELARGGIKPAQIQAGALKGTLTLAAAGELDMGEAANIAVKAMGAFSLKGKDMNSIAAALAGGANASSASVRDMSQALSQSASSANAAGLTIQETTAALAAFSNQGIEGSDAGTSLKTMLQRLVPTTNTATNAMLDLNLASYDATVAAKELKKEGIAADPKDQAAVEASTRAHFARALGLKADSDAVKKAANNYLWSSGIMNSAFLDSKGNFEDLSTIAGALQKSLKGVSDEQRTKDLGALFGSDAIRAANVLGKVGSAGIERLTKATSDQGAAQKQAAANMKGTAGAIESLKGSFETLQLRVGLAMAPMVQFGAKVLTDIVNKTTALVAQFSSGGAKVSAFGATFASLVRFGRDLWPVLKDIGEQVMGALGPGIQQIGDLIRTDFLPSFRDILPVIEPVVKFILEMLGGALVGTIKGAIQVIKGVIQVVSGVFKLISALIHGEWGQAWDAFKTILTGVLNIVLGAFKVWWNIGILNLLRRGVAKLLFGWRDLWTSLLGLGKKGMATVAGWFSKALEAVLGLFVRGVRTYLNVWRGLFVSLFRFAVTGWAALRTLYGRALSALTLVITTAIKAVTGLWKGLFTVLKKTAADAWGVIKKGVSVALGGVRTAFSKAVTAIGKVWSGLKAAAKAPVEFIVNTVYNKGIVPVVNAIPFVPGHLSPLHFAQGGVLPGYSPGRDVHHFHSPTAGQLHLSGGEAIMRPEWTKAVGGEKGVKRLNEMARKGIYHFAGGGIFRPTASGSYGSIHDQWTGFPAVDLRVGTGTPVHAVAPGQVTVSQDLTTSYGHWIKIAHAGFQSLYAHLARRLVGVGASVAGGQLIGISDSTGNSTGPHLHFGVSGRSPLSFMGASTNYGSGGSADTGGGGIGGLISGLWSKAQGLVSGLGGKLGGWVSHLNGMGGWGSMLGGMVKGVVGDVVSWAKDKVGSAVSAGLGASSSPGAAGPKNYAMSILGNYGWGPEQFRPLDLLWTRESGWRWNADNPTSSAYGIPQALPGSKMASAGADWRTNPATQIRWGLNYIKNRPGYGSPAAAWAHSQRFGWYDDGGMLPPGLSLSYNGTGRGEHKAVLTDQQWRTLQQMGSRGTQQLGGYTNNGTVIVRDESALANRILADQRRAQLMAGVVG